MKKFIPIAVLGLIGWLGWKYGRKVLAAKILNIKLKTVKISPISSAAIQLSIINPTNIDFSLDSITADLSINDYAISTLNYQKSTIIKANAESLLDLPIKINPLEGLTFLTKLIFNKSARKLDTIKINGTVNGEGLNIPIDIVQNLTI
jgi:LEA14-like dessication related protein